MHKLTLTNIVNNIIKFITNYIKRQKACIQYKGTVLKLMRINTRVPPGGVLSLTLFNIYTSDIPISFKRLKITTYAYDIIITAFYTKHCKAQQLIQPYLHKIYECTITNNLHINTDKITILFISDQLNIAKLYHLK